MTTEDKMYWRRLMLREGAIVAAGLRDKSVWNALSLDERKVRAEAAIKEGDRLFFQEYSN